MVRFNNFEREALAGINEGKFNLSLASEMLKLRNEGMRLEEIADKINSLKGYPNITPEIIEPLFNFLLKHEAEDVLESYQEYLKGVKIKFCDVCGEEFVESKKVSGQTTCKTCRKKYKSTEIIVLKGYKKGKYNQNTAIYAYNLRKVGLNNKEIAEELKIPSNLVSSIIDLLLPEEYSKKNKDEVSVNNKPKNICNYCGNEFSPESSTNHLFCSKCNNKYDYLDLLLFIGIKEGKYSFKFATKIYKLQKDGSSEKDISEELHIPKELINKVLNFYGFNGKENDSSNNLNNCSVCGNLFVMPKGISNQQYCSSCKEKFRNNQLRVLVGIKEGIYNKNLAIKIKDLLEKGESKASIAKKLKLPGTSVIDPIIEYLYDDEMPDFMKNKNTLFSYHLSKNLVITNRSNNQTNIKLNGIVTNDFAIDFMNILPKIDLRIKKMIFKEKEDFIEFSVNFDIEDSHIEKFLSELIDIGFD